ncbi:MAG: tetratricopeptide repeat protein [bacterium]|nr:tetratricopeptide repeat protein [bacterium]
MQDKFIVKLDKAISIIIKGSIGLLPLFFLPWTSEYFEFNKQFLLWLAMPAALFLWLIKQAVGTQVKIKTNPLNFPALIFLALTLISSIFSLDRYSSFFGYFGRFSDAWLGLASLVIFYFLIINTGLADSREKIIGLVKLFFYSAAAAAALSLMAMFGAIRYFIGDPLSVFSSASFNSAGGSLASLGIFLALMSAAAIGFLLGGFFKKTERYFFSAALAVILIALALISLKPARTILGLTLPREAVLDYRQSLAVSRSALAAHPALGSGPGTFAYSYSLYRPASANAGAFWQIRFDKSGSQLLELLATAGLLAGLSYLLIISLMIYLNIRLISEAGAGDGLAVVLFTVFVLSFFSQIFFLATTVLNFTFWFFLGLLMAYWQIVQPAMFKEKIINFGHSVSSGHRVSKIVRLAVFLAGALWLALAAFEIKFFAADIVAASGQNREASLATAGKLNSSRYNYGVSLAKLYLNRARLEALKPAAARDNNFLQSNLTAAIETAKRAAAAAGYSVLAWETLGMIYRDIKPLASGSEPWAVKSFSQALALEPANPVLAAELAKAYANDNDPAGAEKYFIKSLELKPDYLDGKFGLAKNYLQEKKDGLGFKLLSELSGQVTDAEVYYELGRYYYNHGEIDKAIGRFNLVLSLAPSHANSLYSLGIAYEAKGQNKQAVKYYEKVLELNPGNSEVEKKIKELN